jgi:hypothetical protein
MREFTPRIPLEIRTAGDIECSCKHRATHRGRRTRQFVLELLLGNVAWTLPAFPRLRCALRTWRLTLIPRAMAVYVGYLIAHRPLSYTRSRPHPSAIMLTYRSVSLALASGRDRLLFALHSLGLGFWELPCCMHHPIPTIRGVSRSSSIAAWPRS